MAFLTLFKYAIVGLYPSKKPTTICTLVTRMLCQLLNASFALWTLVFRSLAGSHPETDLCL